MFSWTRRTGWLALFCLFLNVGCLAGKRGYQLYPGPAADASAVAKLSGYVQLVDGKNVSRRGRNFELLPGCHVIVTPKNWGGFGESGGVVATTGAIPFAIRMLAGHSYSIEVRLDGSAGSSGKVRITAQEKDSSGKVTDSFSPAPDDPTCQSEHRGGKDIIMVVPTLGG